jgi:CRISPR-associated protein Csm4
MKLKVYKLHFTSPLHISGTRDDYSVSLKTIASDTMMAALTSCLAKIGESIPEKGDLGFVISDSFPFFQETATSNPVFFFPRPLKINLPDQIEDTNLKKIKKVKWFDKYYFEKVLGGDIIFQNSDIRRIKCDEYIVDKNQSKNFNGIFESQVTPRVTIARDGVSESVPYYVEKITFRDFSGLYFIVDGDTELLEKAMNLLKEEGIGTDRNVGNGFFEYDTDEIELSLPDSADNILSLSNYIPSKSEELTELLSGDKIAYEFHRRGGWITTYPYTSLRKKYVYAFAPGSVFKRPNQATDSVLLKLGEIVDLKPDNVGVSHSIWRNGKSIFLPIKL